jgi:hypothetical protein
VLEGRAAATGTVRTSIHAPESAERTVLSAGKPSNNSRQHLDVFTSPSPG